MQFSKLSLTELFSILLNKALQKRFVSKELILAPHILSPTLTPKEESEPTNAVIYGLAFLMMWLLDQ